MSAAAAGFVAGCAVGSLATLFVVGLCRAGARDVPPRQVVIYEPPPKRDEGRLLLDEIAEALEAERLANMAEARK